jgi:hypothetical protein
MIRLSNKSGNTTTVEVYEGTTYTRTVNGTQVEQRPLTPTEAAYLAAYDLKQSELANQSAIETNLAQDMALMQAIIDTPNVAFTNIAGAQTAMRDIQRQLKDVARNLKRVDRTIVKDYSGTN